MKKLALTNDEKTVLGYALIRYILSLHKSLKKDDKRQNEIVDWNRENALSILSKLEVK